MKKTVHIKWGWFEILHAAQRELLPRCNFFHKNQQKVRED